MYLFICLGFFPPRLLPQIKANVASLMSPPSFRCCRSSPGLAASRAAALALPPGATHQFPGSRQTPPPRPAGGPDGPGVCRWRRGRPADIAGNAGDAPSRRPMGSLAAGDGKSGRGRTRKVSHPEPPPPGAEPPPPPPRRPPLHAQMDPVEVAAVPDAGPGPAWQNKVNTGGAGGSGPAWRPAGP